VLTIVFLKEVVKQQRGPALEQRIASSPGRSRRQIKKRCKSGRYEITLADLLSVTHLPRGRVRKSLFWA
jgi:hypothetical protein